MSRLWTDADRAELRQRYYAGESVKDIAQAMDRTKDSITGQLYFCNIRRHKLETPFWEMARDGERRHSEMLDGYRFEDVPRDVLRAEFTLGGRGNTGQPEIAA